MSKPIKLGFRPTREPSTPATAFAPDRAPIGFMRLMQSTFFLCDRSATNASFPDYRRLPVLLRGVLAIHRSP